VSVWDGGASQVCSPPVLKTPINTHVESLRGWGSFLVGVTVIAVKSKEEAQAGPFHTRGVGVIQGTSLATTSGTVTDATGLWVWASSDLMV
jgi:hypothetical protein